VSNRVTGFGRLRLSALCMLGLFLATTPALTPLEAQQAGAQAPGVPRRPLEQRLRQRLAVIVKRELKLDSVQAQRLGDVSARYETERRQVAVQERDLRQQLRRELQGGEQANQDRVSRALDRMLEIQRTRLDIVQREQQELAKFLTPVQRAKYLVLQDQLRRRLEELRRTRNARDDAATGRP
jgi:protein CpxP